MVSSVGGGTSNNTVAQVSQQQSERVDELRAQQVAEQRKAVQAEIVQENKSAQRKVDADERRGSLVDISV